MIHRIAHSRRSPAHRSLPEGSTLPLGAVCVDAFGSDDLSWPHRDVVDSSERRNAEIDRGVRWTWWSEAMGIIGGMFLRGSVSSS